MPQYSVLIQYDGRDNIYVASIPELSGCIAHGKTQEDAMSEIRIALELWMETATETGISIPKPMLYAS
jgi:predicted RNase H-like HicB family nuclease